MAATVHHAPQTLGPIHPAKVEKSAVKPSIARKITIRVVDPLDHDAPAILHEPRSYNATQANGSAVVLISGAGGGVSGPAGMYPSLADKFALVLAIPCIRLDYREPARKEYCTADVIAAFDYLKEYFNSTKFVVVGWSFGGSPCFAVAAREPERCRAGARAVPRRRDRRVADGGDRGDQETQSPAPVAPARDERHVSVAGVLGDAVQRVRHAGPEAAEAVRGGRSWVESECGRGGEVDLHVRGEDAGVGEDPG